jgi:DNA-binding response OmpR family regulator
MQVILLTGRGGTQEGIQGMRLGAYDYIVKPVKIEELLEKMNQAVELGQESGNE